MSSLLSNIWSLRFYFEILEGKTMINIEIKVCDIKSLEINITLTPISRKAESMR